MIKNQDKLILSGVILSVFIGITGYSVGMSYSNSVYEEKEKQLSIFRKIDETQNKGDNSEEQNTIKENKTAEKDKDKEKKNDNKKSKETKSKSSSRSSRRSSNNGSSSNQRVSSVSNVSIPNKLKDGTYYGVGKGYAGNVKVKVTVSGGKISDISVVSHNETSGYYENGAKVIDKIISSQSTNVDTISGATFTSNAIRVAVADALKNAGMSSSSSISNTNTTNSAENLSLKLENQKLKEEVEKLKAQNAQKVQDVKLDKLKDGKYEGEGVGFQSNKTKVSVEVSSGKIADIKVLGYGDDREYFEKAEKILSDIKNKQSIDVDTVSGATYSSMGIKSAVADALSKAGGNSSSNSGLNDMIKLKDKEIEDLKKAAEEFKDKITKELDKLRSENTSLKSELQKVNNKKTILVDGSYKGEGIGYEGNITKVLVKISEGKIASIKVTEYGDDDSYIKKAKALIEKIIARGSVDKTDVIAKATYSSNGINSAVENALEKAKKEVDINLGNDSKPNKDNNGGETGKETVEGNSSGVNSENTNSTNNTNGNTTKENTENSSKVEGDSESNNESESQSKLNKNLNLKESEINNISSVNLANVDAINRGYKILKELLP